jgi:CubicO group peptidase (beta-lactamase class C family)
LVALFTTTRARMVRSPTLTTTTSANRYPAGGFDASAEDLLRFVIAVGSGKVIKPDTVNDMWTAQRTSDGANTVFGLGWGVSK